MVDPWPFLAENQLCSQEKVTLILKTLIPNNAKNLGEIAQAWVYLNQFTPVTIFTEILFSWSKCLRWHSTVDTLAFAFYYYLYLLAEFRNSTELLKVLVKVDISYFY